MAASSNDPLVTIVLPTYNRAHIIDRAIASVRRQTHLHWELLVIDDASADRTLQRIESYPDRRIRCIRLSQNRGAAHARNVGIEQAQGTFVAFLDSDDEWHPKKLELQVDAFRSTKHARLAAVVCYDNAIYANGDRRLCERGYEGDVYERVIGFDEWPEGVGSSLVIHRSVLDAGVRFDVSLPCFHDWDFFVQIARRFHITTVPQVLTNVYLDAPDSVWSKHRIRGSEAILQKHMADLRRRPIALREHHLRLVSLYLEAGSFAAMRGHLARALFASPGPELAFLNLCALGGTQALDWSVRTLNRLEGRRKVHGGISCYLMRPDAR